MPAYMDTQFEFPQSRAHGLVRRFYDALRDGGAAYMSVFPWGCSADMPLDEVVLWNQEKLNSRFTLGYDQSVRHDYRQILVALQPFSSARVFILLAEAAVRFHLIVPESDVASHGPASLFALAGSVWDSMKPRSIQTYGELGAPVSHGKLSAGAMPSAELFAFVESQYPTIVPATMGVERLLRGRLLRPQVAPA
jgi:hypothetical protein